MSVLSQFHTSISGPEEAPVLMFAHGFGCDQTMWRLVAPAFEDRYRVVLFDYAGFGAGDPSAYDADVHASLDGYAKDAISICEELSLTDVTFVGHSVSAMVGVLAHLARPQLITGLVMIGPSARYVDAGDYVGGFTRSAVDELLELMDANRLGWQDPVAGLVMSGSDQPEVKDELEASFCKADPAIARHFAEVTFLGDNRDDLHDVSAPTLVVQSRSDAIAPMTAGKYVHEHVAGSQFVVIDTAGHCPQLTAPGPTIEAIDGFLQALPHLRPVRS